MCRRRTTNTIRDFRGFGCDTGVALSHGWLMNRNVVMVTTDSDEFPYVRDEYFFTSPFIIIRRRTNEISVYPSASGCRIYKRWVWGGGVKSLQPRTISNILATIKTFCIKKIIYLYIFLGIKLFNELPNDITKNQK